jgi:hypothetical protein
MKKLAFAIVVIALIGGGLWYVKHHRTVKVVSTTATYKNMETGISFVYPKILTVTNTDDTNDNGTVTIHHEIPFTHNDYCNFKGDANGTDSATSTSALTDFNVTMHADNLNLVDTIHTESPYIPAANFVDDQVISSPGFIDAVTIGKLSGYVVTEGAEGCGQKIYFLSISGSKTLVVTDDIITVFTGAIDPSQATAALAVPGVISNTEHDTILKSILQSVSVS